MKEINDIFAIVNEALLSLRYEGEEDHEVDRIFRLWGDVEFLEDFFETHKEDLHSEFYRQTRGIISVKEAVFQTIDEAEIFQEELKTVAEKGKTDENETLHDVLFKPLHKNDPTITHQHSKAYGNYKHSWLRLYAIRLDPNLYVITGGAIKLTETMNERDHTKSELQKLEQAASWLKKIGFENIDDYGFIEIKQ